MKKQKDFDTARLIGMVQALKIAKEKGIDALEADILARKRTGINPPSYFFDLDSCVDEIKAWCLKRISILYIAALVDEFHFGATRLTRTINAVAKGMEYIRTGQASWWDYSQEIDERVGIVITETKDGIRAEVRKK